MKNWKKEKKKKRQEKGKILEHSSRFLVTCLFVSWFISLFLFFFLFSSLLFSPLLFFSLLLSFVPFLSPPLPFSLLFYNCARFRSARLNTRLLFLFWYFSDIPFSIELSYILFAPRFLPFLRYGLSTFSTPRQVSRKKKTARAHTGAMVRTFYQTFV